MKRLLVLLLTLLLLAGCGADPEVYVPTGNGLTTDEGDTPVSPTQPQKEKELTLVYYPNETFNPYTCSDFTNRALFSLMYQGLFTTDKNYNAQPMLCGRFTVSEDMKTYVFYVADATFWDGTYVTAEDVLASLEAAKAGNYYAGRFAHVSSMSLTADGGVCITLDTACEDLPILLDIPIVKAADVALDRPTASGPYFPDTTAGRLRLRKNNKWWCQAALAVNAESIYLLEAESPVQICDSFKFSDVGLVCANPGSASYTDYRCDYELWDCENGVFLYLGCNTESKLFSNPEVRKALTHAIDRDLLVENHYRGFAYSASLPAAPMSPYYSKSLASRYSYDPEKFSQAAAQVYLEDPVKLLVNKADTRRLQVAREIVKMLTAAGLQVELVTKTGDSYEYALATRQYDLYLGQTKLSPNMDLTPFFRKNGALRYGGMTDASLYAMCLEALANKGNYYNLHQKVMEDGRLCPILFQSYSIYAARGLMQGLEPARDAIFHYTLDVRMADIREELESQ